MDTLDTIELKAVRATRLISLIGLAGLLALSAITVLEVLMRSIFKYPIHGVFDLSQLIIVIATASCLPLVCAQRRHITVRLIGSVAGKRMNNLLEAFGALITMIIFVLLTWQLFKYYGELSASNETSWLMKWPLAPWWLVASIIIALGVPTQLILFINSLRRSLINENNRKSGTETLKSN